MERDTLGGEVEGGATLDHRTGTGQNTSANLKAEITRRKIEEKHLTPGTELCQAQIK